MIKEENLHARVQDWYYDLMQHLTNQRDAFQREHPELDFYPNITFTWEVLPDGKKHLRCYGGFVAAKESEH